MCKRKHQNHWSWLPFLVLSVGAVSTSLAGQFESCPNCEVCQGCPYHVNGDCITSPRTFGYYRTNWRRWPGEPREGLPSGGPNLEDMEIDIPDPIQEDELTITPKRRFGSGSRPALGDPGAAGTPVLPPFEDDLHTDPFEDDSSPEDLDLDEDLNLDEDTTIEDEILAPQTSTRRRLPLGKNRSTKVSWQSRQALRPNSLRKKTRQRPREIQQVVALEPVREKRNPSRSSKNPLRASTRTDSNATLARNRVTKSNPLR